MPGSGQKAWRLFRPAGLHLCVIGKFEIRLINGTLRHYGLPQQPLGVSPVLDLLKVIAHDAMRAVHDPLRKSENIRRVLRGPIYGHNVNY